MRVHTPEIIWENNQIVREFVTCYSVSTFNSVISKTDFMWAVIADVYLESGENLTEHLILNGYGRRYDGGRRLGWC